MMSPKAKIGARILLLVALYTFVWIPLTPLLAQEGVPEEATTGVTYTVQQGDTFRDIDVQELSDSPLRPRFWLNNSSITHLDFMDPGKRLNLAQMGQMPVRVQGQPPLGETLPDEKPKAWYHNREWWVWIVLGVTMVAVVIAGAQNGGDGDSSTGTVEAIVPPP